MIVWKKSMLIVTSIYKLTSQFPDDEKFGLTSQIKRSAVSIPSNIAEGYGRNYRKDYSRFLQISRGSLYENQTQMEIAVNLSFLNVEDLKEIS
ncbi:four helix bundle protein [Flavobacterium limnosediminis]|nr:four helix bundle protein [Flavobacterium limnosediminis]